MWCLPKVAATRSHTSTPLQTAQAEPAAVAGVEFGWDTAEPAAAPSLALELRCAKLEAELAALRARLHEAETRCATQRARALN